MLLFHIICALSGLIITGLAYLRPSQPRIFAAGSLAAATLITGTYLIWTHPAHVVSGVLTGLIYLAVVLAGIVAAAGKLARLRSDQ